MAQRSNIEWTDASWTPVKARNRATGKVGWHCEHVSEGCANCYAEGMNLRLGTKLPFKPGHRKDIEIVLDEEMLTAPMRWSKRMIFVCSMTDLFADFVTDKMIDRVFAVMALCPQHTFQVLTKRSARMRRYLSQFERRGHYVCSTTRDQIWRDPRDGNSFLLLQEGQSWPLPNVWLGVSAERQKEADERIPDLLATPAAVRFISAEPLLGPINLSGLGVPTVHHHPDNKIEAIETKKAFGALVKAAASHLGSVTLDQVIVGGESGPRARPMHPQWPRDLRDQCEDAGVPFFFKQHGEFAPSGTGDQKWIVRADASYAAMPTPAGIGHHSPMDGSSFVYRVGKKAAGRLLDGVEHNGMPGDNRRNGKCG
jgi:protein gp37